MSINPAEEVQDTTPRRPRKRSAEGAELEIDVNAPEPPSKKARRKAKKQATTGPEPDSKEEPDLKRLNGLEGGRSNHGVWIGNLAFTTSKKALYEFLTRNSISSDSITRLHLPLSEANRTHSKGFAYVDFASQDIVESAVQLSESLLDGRRLLIKDAKNFQGRPDKPKEEKSISVRPPSRKIFVGNLDFETTVKDVEKHFGVCGPVLKTQVASFEDSGKCKGYAWIEFESLSSAENAMRGWVEVEKPTKGEDGKKTMKPKKVWLHRMGNRRLRMEYAEDATTRYKKRFASDASTAKPETPGEDSEVAAEAGPEAAASPLQSAKDARVNEGKNAGGWRRGSRLYQRRRRRLSPLYRGPGEGQPRAASAEGLTLAIRGRGRYVPGTLPKAGTSDASAEEDGGAKRGKEKLASADDAQPAATSFSTTAETEAMLNGLKISDGSVETEELRFDDAEAAPQLDGMGDGKPAHAPASPRNETLAQKSRREHQAYIKERNSNPAFVPNRGGFFLHDDRSDRAAASMRTAARGRGRDGRGPIPPGPSHKAPNRNFSFTTVIGNVSVNVSMPGAEKKTTPMVKKHHTLLPQHRPPLRRDKPVRISVPDAQPRYIFPSTERSFIFIPRALRPNQQSNSRGIRPVVRMPVGMAMPGPVIPTRNSSGGSQYGAPMAGSLSYGFHSTAIPMHQPRPQKAVSVGAIESPASFSVKGPQHQYDQPFHQQMPQFVAAGPEESAGMGGHLSGVSGGAAGVAMSHLPEGAMYANPFQPIPMMHGPMLYSGPYFVAGGMQFPAPVPGMPLFQTWAPAPPSQPPLLENVHHAGALGNEAGGMVFYNGAAPPPPDGQAQEPFMMRGGAMNGGVPTMMNPQAPYYYPAAPSGTFYPTHSS
ncbi:hypothetical protein DV737_g728, partial [Chaetothyriales sp. CBS 132003]